MFSSNLKEPEDAAIYVETCRLIKPVEHIF